MSSYFGAGVNNSQYQSKVNKEDFLEMNNDKKLKKIYSLLRKHVTHEEIKKDKLNNADEVLKEREKLMRMYKRDDLDIPSFLLPCLSEMGFLCVVIHNIFYHLSESMALKRTTINEIIVACKNYLDARFVKQMEDSKVPMEEWEDRRYALDQEIMKMEGIKTGKVHEMNEHK